MYEWIKANVKAAILIGVVVLLALFAVYHFVSPMVDDIKGWFGIETKASLKQELAVEKKNVGVLTDVNKGLVQDNTIKAGTLENTQDAVEQQVVAQKVTRKTVKAVLDTSTEKIAAIEAAPISAEEKHIQISQVHITSIWQAYCAFNEEPSCKDIPKVEAEVTK